MIGRFRHDGKEYGMDIDGRLLTFEEYLILYSYGRVKFMDSYWVDGYEYYAANGVKWLGYRHNRDKHGEIFVGEI